MQGDEKPELQSVAFIGVGLMAEIMAERAIAAGWPRERLLLSHYRHERVEALQAKFGGTVYRDNLTPAGKADLVLIAVRPQAYAEILESLMPVLRAGQIVISIAAALNLAWLKSRVPSGVKVVRVTPPPTALAGYGTALLSAEDDLSADERRSVERIVGPVCEGVLWIPDEMTDPVTSVANGIFPYLCLFLDTLIKAGTEQGLDPELSRRMVMTGFWASARQLHEKPTTPAQYLTEVTRDGLAQSSVHTMQAAGFPQALRAGARALTGRSFQLRGDEVPAEFSGFLT